MSDDKISEQRFLEAVKTGLTRSGDNIDEITLAKLHRARSRAIDQLARNSGLRTWSDWLVPAGAVTATLAIAVMVFNFAILFPSLDAESRGREMLSAMDDIHILGAQEDLELFEELEFYAWLVDENERG